MKYAPKSFKLEAIGHNDIEVSRTILKDTKNYIGINCGCYSKFHRQVAHIRHAMMSRAIKEKK